jgi:hypothetical protein
MSEGTPKPATCPRCRGPLAYGHATATRMRCGRRFGKAFLRGGLGLGHLTEGRSRESARHEPSPEADREQRQPERAEQEQERPLRMTGTRPLRMTGTRPHDRRCADRCEAMIADGRIFRARAPTLACAGGRHLRPRARSSFPRRPPGAPRASRTLMPDHTGARCGSGMGSSRRPVRGMSLRPRPMITAVNCRARRNRATGGHGRNRSLRLLLLLLLRGRGLLGRLPRRQERQGVDVPVRVGRSTDAEIHVRLGPLGITARADRADDVALAHLRPDRDPDRAEVNERHRPPVLGADRQAQPLMGQPPRVRDDTRRG